jgi:hypothetical protein
MHCPERAEAFDLPASPRQIKKSLFSALSAPAVKSFFLLFHISLFFAIDTAAILLTIQSHCLGDLHPFSPSLPKVLVIERNPHLPGYALPCLPDQGMILVGTLKKGG